MSAPVRHPLPWLLCAAVAGCASASAPGPQTGPTAEPAAAVLGKTVILVRHAEKAKDGTDDPPLTEAGIARALELARVLQDVELSAVFASQYQRTSATVTPAAKQAGLTVEVVDAGTPEALLEKIDAASGVVLVAGHSNTLGPLVLGLKAPAIAEITHQEYDGLYVVQYARAGSTVMLLRYGAPGAIPAAE